ncbi:hypothetical protein [Granulicella sp. WH15]|uniref:hypothetical protein n=1 Tax=Granulicella sp. WH15 TaxID=2602070 RepID=UPI0013A53640|nr:hypothetical protein [Granulicella sp. WH15]
MASRKDRRMLQRAISLPFPLSPAARTMHTLLFLLASISILSMQLCAQQGNPSGDPKSWAEDAAHNELKVIQFDRFYLRYRAHIANARGVQLRDVLETRDGTVARLIARDDRPLTAEEDAAERSRLQAMLDSPAAFAKHVKGDVTGKKLAVDMVKMMPDAMIYTYVPGQPQTGRPGPHAPEVVLDFAPNPRWSPPNLYAEALTGFKGRIWIDSESRILVRLDGTIFQGVNFGFGMIGHIYPGGRLMLEQTNAGQQHWIFSHFVEHLTVRALMVKTLHENSEITSSEFQMVPAMSYQEAIHTLLETPLPTHIAASGH